MFFNRGPAVSGVIQCVVGSMQGDPTSGIWFNAGLQKAFNQLRAEFPEVLLAKCYDDVNGFIHPSEDRRWYCSICRTSEARAESFDGCYDTADGTTPATVPLALTLVHRWKFIAIAHQTCDLTIRPSGGCPLCPPPSPTGLQRSQCWWCARSCRLGCWRCSCRQGRLCLKQR
jgi:hypothetical protein